MAGSGSAKSALPSPKTLWFDSSPLGKSSSSNAANHHESERVSVNQLMRAGKQEKGVFLRAENLARSQGQNQTDSFAAGKNSVAPRLEKAAGATTSLR